MKQYTEHYLVNNRVSVQLNGCLVVAWLSHRLREMEVFSPEKSRFKETQDFGLSLNRSTVVSETQNKSQNTDCGGMCQTLMAKCWALKDELLIVVVGMNADRRLSDTVADGEVFISFPSIQWRLAIGRSGLLLFV